MPRCFGEPGLVGRVEADLEERPGDAPPAVVLAQHRDSRLAGVQLLDAQGLAPTAPELDLAAARAFLTQLRSPYGATAYRSPASSTSDTGVVHGLPVRRPGTVSRWVRGPTSPAARAAGRAR